MINKSVFLNKFFNQLNALGFDYCFLRNYENYPDLEEGDIDLLIQKENLKLFLNEIKNISSRENWDIIRIWGRFNFIQIQINNVLHPNIIVTIDLFFSISWRGLCLLSSEYVLSKRIKYKDIFIPDPSHEFISSCFLMILAGRRIKDKVKKKIIEKFNDNILLFYNDLVLLVGKNLAKFIIYKIENNIFEFNKSYIFNIRMKLIYNLFKRNHISQVKGIMMFIFKEIIIMINRLNFIIDLNIRDVNNKEYIKNKYFTKIILSYHIDNNYFIDYGNKKEYSNILKYIIDFKRNREKENIFINIVLSIYMFFYLYLFNLKLLSKKYVNSFIIICNFNEFISNVIKNKNIRDVFLKINESILIKPVLYIDVSDNNNLTISKMKINSNECKKNKNNDSLVIICKCLNEIMKDKYKKYEYKI